MSAFQPRPFCQRRAHHLPGPGGDGSPARLPEVAGLPAPEPGRPQRSLGLRPYWLALILMDIRALGPLQANYTSAARGNVASDFRASEISQGDFGEGTRKGPTFKAPPAHSSLPAALELGPASQAKRNRLSAHFRSSEFAGIPLPRQESSGGTVRLLKWARRSTGPTRGCAARAGAQPDRRRSPAWTLGAQPRLRAPWLALSCQVSTM